MRPIVLHGHERSITQIKYNKQGDLLFSVAKDHSPTIWFSENGERVGTYDGHSGALWCIDVNRDSCLVLTGAADNTSRLWDCETGKCIRTFDSKSSVRVCAFSDMGTRLIYSTDAKMGHKCELVLYDTNSEEPTFQVDIDGARVTAAQWGLFDEHLITGHEDGEIKVFDVRNLSKPLEKAKKHTDAINDMQMNKDRTMFITASKDHSAKVLYPLSLYLSVNLC
jgi:translation initiation factor 3 subunit I